MNKKTFLGLIVIAIIAIGGCIYLQPKAQINQDKAGAVSGPDINSPYLNVNGVSTEYRSMGFSPATTTPCVIKSPAASSTLAYSTFNVYTATSTAGTVTLATSTTAFATTTPLFTTTIPSGLTRSFQFVASTTDASGLGQTIAPSTYLVYGVAGQSYGYTYGGSCKAVFRVL